jgi:hypothetical protein
MTETKEQESWQGKITWDINKEQEFMKKQEFMENPLTQHFKYFW